jgi:polyphosphate kinase 2 (PPK2 family)
MYAHNRYGVLICLQGMDTSGKDSLIREVFKDFNLEVLLCTVLKHLLRKS